MPSTPTPRLRIMQQERGENLNIWGDPNLNNALLRLEEAAAGVLTIPVTGDFVLASTNYVEDQARYNTLVLTGTPTAAFKITIPGVQKPYTVINTTGQTANIGVQDLNAVAVRAGTAARVICDGEITRVIDPTLDQVRRAVAPVDLGNNRVINVGRAEADTDGVSRGQVAGLINSATTGAIATAVDAAQRSAASAVRAENASLITEAPAIAERISVDEIDISQTPRNVIAGSAVVVNTANPAGPVISISPAEGVLPATTGNTTGVLNDLIDTLQSAGILAPPLPTDPSTSALLARFATAPTRARANLINRTITRLKAAGVWAKLDLLYVMAASDQQAASLNWISSAATLTPNGTVTFDPNRGFTGSGASGQGYLDTGIPRTSLSKWSMSEASLSAFELSENNTGALLIGTVAGADNRLQSRINGSIGGRVNGNSGVAFPVSSSVGLSSITRSGGNIAAYKNGVLVGSAAATIAGLNRSPITLLRDGGLYSDRTIAMAALGSSLTAQEQQAFSQIITAYMQEAGAANASQLFAPSAVTYDLSSGAISKSLNADEVYAPASLTKIVTCLTICRLMRQLSINPATLNITIQASDITSGSGNNLAEGDVITIRSAIANLMLPSSNTTATAVARSFGVILGGADPVARFVEEMNATAGAIGMASSTFLNPHGLSAVGQRTTARDMMTAGVVAQSEPEITRFWGMSQYTMRVTGPNIRLVTIATSVKLVLDGDTRVLGGKTGTLTPTVHNLLVLHRDSRGRRYLSVTLVSPNDTSRYVDMRKLLDAVG